MGSKKKRSLNKEIIKQQVEEIKKLPPKTPQKYEATMDNVIVECFWKKQDEKEAYQYPHVRGVDCVKIVSVGPMVKNIKFKKNVKVMVSTYGHELVRDEVSAISVIKAHEIILIIK